jgi:hypothetical protein
LISSDDPLVFTRCCNKVTLLSRALSLAVLGRALVALVGIARRGQIDAPWLLIRLAGDGDRRDAAWMRTNHPEAMSKMRRDDGSPIVSAEAGRTVLT